MTATIYQFPKENVRITIKRRLKVAQFYNEAWKLIDRYTEIAANEQRIAQNWAAAGNMVEYEAARKRQDKAYDMATHWYNIADSLGNDLDRMGGAL